MAGSQQQLDFPGADADAASVFRYRMSRLRDELAAVPLNATGLSGLRWQQLRELMMAIMSYQLAGRQPKLTDMLRTSGLSRDQWYVARENALALGLIVASRRYTSRCRETDHLTIDQEAIARLRAGPPGPTVAPGPTRSDQVRPSPTKSDQVRPSPTSIKEDTTRATKELPIYSSTSSVLTANTATAIAEVEVEILGKGNAKLESAAIAGGTGLTQLVARCRAKFGRECPQQIERALRQAIDRGCSIEQLVERCTWFFHQRRYWKADYRAGVLHDGLADATPELAAADGWPYR